MAVAAVNTALSVYGTEAVVTFNAATSSVVDATEAFTITPTRPGSKLIMRAGIANSQGAVAWSIAAGGTNHFGNGAADTGSIAQNTSETFVINTARHMSDAGTIIITFTPASGKRLLTDHVLVVDVVELPF